MLRNWLLLSVLLSIVSSAPAGWDPAEHQELIQEASVTIQQFKRKDPSLKRFFNNAVGWAVYPTVGKAGFWVGGAYGKGVVYQRGQVIGFSELRQVSIGLQFGGQAYSEIIFFRDQAALDRLKREKLEFDAQASAVVADKGAALNADYHSGVAVFTLPKGGLMAEASVGGQQFTFDPR
jgi:lipid-binding SYLF domain-containing protein